MVLSLSMCLLLGHMLPRATAQSADSASVQAAYVINFMRYTQWPARESAGPAYEIAVLGSGMSVAALRSLAARAGALRGRPIVVRVLPLNAVAPAEEEARRALRRELGQPHAVYVAPGHGEWNRAVIEVARGRPILTIGVGAGFVEQGGMLGLVQDRDRVAFRANDQAVRAAPVEVSARVMMLARPAPPGGR